MAVLLKALKIYLKSLGNKIDPNFPYEQLLQFKLFSKIMTRCCRLKLSDRSWVYGVSDFFYCTIRTYCFERTESHLILEPKLDV